jgi:competence ComEA-like helix-hairpin-helix protein
MLILFKKTLVFCLILSSIVSAPIAKAIEIPLWAEQEMIELPARDVDTIMNSLLSGIANKQASLISSASSKPEEGAVLVLLKTGIRTNSVKYLITQAPFELLEDFVSGAKKIAAVVADPSLSTLARITLDEAKKVAVDWLVKNNLKVGGGNLLVSSYTTYEGEKASATFPYILVYNPQNDSVEIKIYSSKTIKPPESKGGLTSYSSHGGFWDLDLWLAQKKSSLSPFIVKVNGKIEKGKYGGYVWKQGPHIDIVFSNSVIDFEFKDISFLQKQLNSLTKQLIALKAAIDKSRDVVQGAKDYANDLWQNIISGLSNIAEIGGSSVSSFFNSLFQDSSVISLNDEVGRTITKTIQDNPSSELDDEKIRKLEEEIARLEKELSQAIKPETKETKKETVEVKSTVSERININTASKEELIKIIHIGPARADEIIRLRPFSSLDDLIKISGIGEKTLADIKNQGLAYVDEKEIKDLKEEVVEKDVQEKKEQKDYCLNGINVNTASAEELSHIIGIGPTLAQRIINARPFSSIDDLLKVSGIGVATLQKIKEQNCAYVIPAIVSGGGSSPIVAQTNPQVNQPEKCVDINSDSQKDLERLTGIGPVLAQRIIDARFFSSIDDLLKVSGIGTTTLQKIKDQGLVCEIKKEEVKEEEVEEEVVFEIIVTNAETVWNSLVGLSSPNVVKSLSTQTLDSVYLYSTETSFNLDLSKIDYQEPKPLPLLLSIIIVNGETSLSLNLNNEFRGYNISLIYEKKTYPSFNNTFCGDINRFFFVPKIQTRSRSA